MVESLWILTGRPSYTQFLINDNWKGVSNPSNFHTKCITISIVRCACLPFTDGFTEVEGAPSGPSEVELTLVSWKKVEDVTPDGGVLKKVLCKTDDDYKKPNEGASVTIRCAIRLGVTQFLFLRP